MTSSTPLSRDNQILRLVNQGLTHSQIGDVLGITVQTIKAAIYRLSTGGDGPRRFKAAKEGRVVVPIPSAPSASLVALAAFDPVIDRALRLRLALRAEDPVSYGLSPTPQWIEDANGRPRMY